MPLVIRRSLNTTGRAFRYRELEWEWVRVFGPAMTGVSFIGREDHLAKPVTKKDILQGYLTAGRYGNFKTPRV